jgi:hypothetical protein
MLASPTPSGYHVSMNKTLRAIRRGVKAALENPKPHHFQTVSQPVVCSLCGGDSFERYGVAGFTYAGYGLECSRCGHLEYFAKQPTELD